MRRNPRRQHKPSTPRQAAQCVSPAIPAAAGIRTSPVCRRRIRPPGRPHPGLLRRPPRLNPDTTLNSPAGIQNSPRIRPSCLLTTRTSVHYSETRMRQPARRPENSCPDRHPPQPRRGRAPGAKTDPAMPNPIQNRRRTTIGEQPFGLTKRASRKRPNPCRNLY